MKLALAVLSLAACAHAQPVDFTAQDLGLLPGAFGNVALGLNNLDEVVGWNQGPQTQLRAYVWRPGQGISELPPPPGFTESRANDISDTGYIVGGANTGLGTVWSAWRLYQGQYLILPQLPASCSGMMPNAVNNSGEMVGYICPDGGIGTPRAWYYSDATGLIDLTSLGMLTADDINNDGVVTGRSAAGPAYRWSLGTGIELIPFLPGYEDYAQGHAINASGAVAGRSVNAVPGTNAYRPFLSNGPGQAIDLGGISRSFAEGINAQGFVVGSSGTSSTPTRDAWVWTPALVTTRPIEVLVAGLELPASRGRDINNNNKVIASLTYPPHLTSGSVLLTPVAPLGCDSIDFNGDGLFPDNQDLTDFFSVFGGGACSTGSCGDLDFNNDGLFPDNADLEALLRVFGGGACG
ncbi:MAG TPA: hypothetical protein VD971_05840 [Phycisphaerales bacterium]|nr:hypothetical protein [Phycisphaerales bacterium]